MSGDLLELYQLAMEPTLSREEAIVSFQRSPSYFRNTYKSLKDRLLDGVLQSSFSQYSKIQQVHFGIWKKYVEAIILIQIGKAKTGTIICEEVIVLAERYGLMPIALDISRVLENSYANLGDNKYLKYQSKVAYLSRFLKEEQQAQSVYNALIFRIRKNKSWNDLIPDIKNLDILLAENKQYKFRLYYYTIYNIFYQFKSDADALAKNCEAAFQFFESCPTILPYTTKFVFLYQVIPTYIAQGNFVKAEQNLHRCMSLPNKGSYNWHLIQQYLAILGFHSHKLAIVENAIKLSNKAPKKFDSELIEARWKVIKVYLLLFEKVDQGEDSSFRLYSFINSIDIIKNDTLKINIYILELMHLLFQGRHKAYMDRTEGLEQYISRNVKGKDNPRAKFFLRMLRCVELGAYNLLRVEAHAKKNKARLRNTPRSMNMQLLDSEIVPYDMLWNLVLTYLKNKQ